MRVSMDKVGRIVIPKALRAQVGLEQGGEVEVTVNDGRVEIEPATVELRLVERDGHLVFVGDEHLPPLTTEDIRDILERVRR